MKKGDKPKDLSQQWWSKNKAKTLKSTGLGKVLGAYEKLRAGTQSLKYFQDCYKELNKIPAAVEKSKKMCNEKLHAETLAALDGYSAVISKEMQALSKDETEYTKKLSIFKSSREKLVKELTDMHQKADQNCTLGKSGLKKLKEAVEKKDVATATKLANAVRSAGDTTVKIVEDAIKKCAPWRTGESPYNQPGLEMNDRDNAGGTKTLETINPLMVQLGSFKTDASKFGEEVDKLLKKLG